MPPELPEIVRAAARRPEVIQAVAELYRDLQSQIDQRRPVCVASGRCCRFEQAGHRLFVTTMELAAFVSGLAADPDRSTAPSRWDGTGCPYQVGLLCGVRSIRPMGCRIYFCDATSTEWQQQQYETLHERLRNLHERLEVPYRYVEWRTALADLGLARGPSGQAYP